MAINKTFINKWNGMTLSDDGSYVSKDFHSFQVSFFKATRKMAKNIGAELVNISYGHYDMSGFIKRGDRYVYFSYDNCCGYGGRTHIILKRQSLYNTCSLPPMYVRSAANDRDYRGGTNNHCYFDTCEEIIERLLNQEHHAWR